MPEPGFLRAVEVLTNALLTPQEFARHKPAAGQMEMKWITVHPHGEGEEGRRIQINTKTGEIEKGFGAGKTMHEAFAPKSEAPAASETPKPAEEFKSPFHGDEESRHWYGASNRPIGHATVPRGFVETKNHDAFRHGAVAYPQPLSDKDQYDYELTPIHGDDAIPELAKKLGGEMDEYASQYAGPENDGILDDFLGQEKSRKLLGHVDKDKLKAEFRKQFGQPEEESAPEPQKPDAPAVDTESLKEHQQMYRDNIATLKAQGKPIPQKWIDGLADVTDKLKGKTPEQGLIASNQVFGHPQSTSNPKFRNLIPIRVGDAASVERRMTQAQSMLDELQTKIFRAEATADGRIKAMPRQKKDASTYLNSHDGHEDRGNMIALRDETLPELSRLHRELASRSNPAAAPKPLSALPPEIAAKYPSLAEGVDAKPEAAKEPWQMRRDDFVDSELDKAANDASHPEYPAMKSMSAAGRWSQWKDGLQKKLTQKWHESRDKAVLEGKPVSQKPAWMLTKAEEEKQYGNGASEHRQDIRDALAAGKPVPAEVLADYPELKPKSAFKPEGIPGEQMGLFDQDAGGQKSLFNVVKPDKKSKKAEPTASTLEKIGDEHKARSEESAPLPGQKSIEDQYPSLKGYAGGQPESSGSPSDLLAKAQKYTQYGENYSRNIATSANRLQSLIDRGFSVQQIKMAADELATRLKVHGDDSQEDADSGSRDQPKPRPSDDDWKPENHIKIAADDIGKLRKQDVYRLMENATGSRRAKMADYIRQNRPELAGEVQDSIDDLGGDSTAPEPAKAAESKPSGHAIDPLDIGKHNIAEVLDNQKADILKSDPKLSPNAAASLAGARVFNALRGRSEEFRNGIDDRVRRGEEISDDEDAKYIAAGDDRRNLHSDIVQHTGYRPMGEVDGHPEANKPLVGGDSQTAESSPKAKTKPAKFEMPTDEQLAGMSPKRHQAGYYLTHLDSALDDLQTARANLAKAKQPQSGYYPSTLKSAEAANKKAERAYKKEFLAAQAAKDKYEEFSRKAPHEELIHHLHEAMNHDGKCCYEKEEGEDDIADHVPADHRHMDKSVHELCRHLGASHPELQAAYENYTAAME